MSTGTMEATSTHRIESALETLHGEKSRSFSETVALEDLKYHYDLLEETNRALSAKLARAEAKYENADVDGLLQEVKELTEKNTGLEAQVATLTTDKKKLNTQLKGAQADVESYKASTEQRVRRVTQLEKQIKILREEHTAFKEAVFELLGIDKSKMTTTTTMELIKDIRGGKHSNKGSEKEIFDLQAQLVASRVGVRPPPVDQDAMKRIHELEVAAEQGKYTRLADEVKYCRKDSKKQSAELTTQLETAYAEFAQIQSKLTTMQTLANQSLTIYTAAFARLGAVKHHKCKYSVMVFKALEGTDNSWEESSDCSDNEPDDHKAIRRI
ncbi:hypothetical protein M408DRAFT_330438 [Serendipita vermifera MAFF 305830]|uniref:Uncharacterized protein n=1 Tax=Serendipita vermifera MAFF 305830 TaxID=933852 RepID=A0A0C3B3A2_SERVB|nr:hypothetical protein M408DRAFT_330438 [Serendipita vermifera MAFF 305830]